MQCPPVGLPSGHEGQKNDHDLHSTPELRLHIHRHSPLQLLHVFRVSLPQRILVSTNPARLLLTSRLQTMHFQHQRALHRHLRVRR